MRVNITPHPTRDGWYYLEYRPDGKKGKRERRPVKGYDNAVTIRNELEAAYDRPVVVISHPCIEKVYEEYLEYCKRTQSAATYKNKTYSFNNRIIPHFGRFSVRELTQRIYDEFQQKQGNKRRSIILYQDYLGALIKWMIKRNMAEPLPFTPEKPKYHLPRHSIKDVTDLDTFIAAIGHEEKLPATIRNPAVREKKLAAIEMKRMILTTMLWTGLRWNEVINLQWEDVNLLRGEIVVKESEQEEQAFIQIAPDMKEWYEQNAKPSGPVFANPKTKRPYGTLKTIMRHATKLTGIDITPHDIRRVSAMMVYEATGGDLLAVQKHLRHKDIKTTTRYLECSGARMNSAHESMVKHIEKKRTSGQLLKTK